MKEVHGRVVDACAIFASMRAEEVLPSNSTLRVILKAASREPCHQFSVAVLNEALAWARDSAHIITPRSRIWNLLTHAVTRRYAMDDPLRTLPWMWSRGSVLVASMPEAWSYNEVLLPLERAGYLALANKMLRHSGAATPNTITYNALRDATLAFRGRLPARGNRGSSVVEGI